MNWAWGALLPEAEVPGARRVPLLQVAAEIVTGPHGPQRMARLAAWPEGPRPHASAVRIDAAVLDGAGTAAVVVWQLLDRDRAPLFDDPAVQRLAQRLAGPDLEGIRPAAVSTCVRDAVHYAGGLTVHRDGRSAERVTRDSWLRRLGPVLGLQVGRGFFGAPSPRPGPGTQRYGGQPWPVTHFR
jgi:hypothetical protein